MAIKILLSDSTGAKVYGVNGTVIGQNVEISELQLTYQGHDALLTVTADSKIAIPVDLLEKPAGGGQDDRIFRKLEDVVGEDVAALRERLRRTLHQDLQVDLTGQHTFFGVSKVLNADIRATLRVRLSSLDGGGSAAVALAARARADVKIQIGGASVSATLVLAVDVTAKVTPTVYWEGPSWPAFDIPFPEFDFTNLSFGQLSGLLPAQLPSFALPRLPFSDQLSFVWSKQPKFNIAVAGGALTLTTDIDDGSGDLKAGADTVANLTGFGIKSGADKFQVQGKVTFNKTWTPADRIIQDGLPFEISLSGIAIAAQFNAPVTEPTDLTIVLAVDKVRIQAKSDPHLFLVLRAKVEVAVTTTGMTTTLKTLQVVDPYPIDLIMQGVQGLAGALMRLSVPVPTPTGGSPLPNLGPFLTRIADMLAAAAAWLSEQAGQAAQVLASVAESAFAFVAKAMRNILDAGASVPVMIEVRLEPTTYRLRQILITPQNFAAATPDPIQALGLTIAPEAHFKPCLVIDLGERPWVGMALINESANLPGVTISTDLWLARSTSAAQPVKGLDETSGQKDTNKPLIQISAKLKQDCALVLFSFRQGRLEFLQKTLYDGAKYAPVYIGETGALEPLTDGDVDVTVDAKGLQDRLTNLLTKPKTGTATGSKFLESLETHVKINVAPGPIKANLVKRFVSIDIQLIVTFNETFSATTKATLTLSLDDLSVRLTGADRISIPLVKDLDPQLLGLQLHVDKNLNGEVFYLDLSGGKEEFGLGKDGKASITVAGMASNGGGLKFDVGKFQIGRDGLNLSAETTDDPVILGGINMPFRFHSGKIEVVNSRVMGANLSGSGQLPPALIGEANVSINLRLKDDGGHVVVESAEAKLDKGEDPIVCESTRFRFSLSKVEMAFEREGAEGRGNYHFYFLLTGKAEFRPRAGEFAAGLLKNLAELDIVLDRAPLTGDGRVLMQRVNFQARVDPPRKSRFFDLFEFELRGIGFHPSAPAFDGSPAVSISGQVKFTNFADKIQPTFRFHELWVAPPERGQSLPQVRFDGLTVGLDLGGLAEVEGTAIAVDGNLPTIFKPDTLPANVTANGFLASGRLSIKGWASMSASMGFLELKKKNENDSHLAFFLYIQQNKLAVPIPTPVGKIYLREVGYGFGWRYTLAGIAEAETATNPKDLIRILDDVSKYQGSLDQIEAWAPTYDSATLTLAMRAMFSLNSTSQPTQYDEDGEKELPNPVLFDVTAAIRSDLTFLMSVRAWLCVNYADWLKEDFEGRTRPSLRGYLYISVPKRTFLGRFIGDSSGFLGKHPDLPAPLRKALELVKIKYSSTLYITPGLFHQELGWPYELSVELGDPNGNFYLACQGGYVFRVEDGAALQGYALRALGFAQIGVNTGGSFGAAIYARADFAIEGKLLSYLSLRAPGETMFYGAFRFDVHLSVSVRVWLEFSVFGGTIRWEFGFSFGVTLALGLECAVLLNRGIGIRAYASIGIQAFGRSLSLGVELRVGDGVLDEARARVDRFLALGLAVSTPEAETMGKPPALEPSRQERAVQGDQRIEDSAKTVPEPVKDPPKPNEKIPFPTSAGDAKEIDRTDFWAMLFPTASTDTTRWYVMQLIPRDLTGGAAGPGSFFAPKYEGVSPVSHQLKAAQTFQALEWKDSEVKPAATIMDRSMSSRPLDQGIKLADIWQENFLAWSPDGTSNGLKFFDPPGIAWDSRRVPLPAGDDEAARALEMSGRQLSSLPDPERRFRHIEERRSAMIVTVVNSAFKMAQTGAAGGWWKPDPKELLHCVDLGLTFLVSEKDVNDLFHPDPQDLQPKKANGFQISRRKNNGDYTDLGDIYLFNPPARMFQEMQPRLKDLSIEATPAGLALNWDLEPAWKDAGTDFWNDPEFHLRHYRIRRIVSDGGDEQWSCNFEVKAGAPRVFKQDNDSTPASFHKPPLQFFDDLTQPASMPREVKEILTGDPPKDQNGKLDRRQYKVTYEIFAEDVAGMRDSGTVKEFQNQIPKTVVGGPRAAELVVEYSGKQANWDALNHLTALKLALTYDRLPDLNNFQIVLSVVKGSPLPGGQYGAEAISTALESVTDYVIDSGEHFDLKLSPKPGWLAAEFPPLDDTSAQVLDAYHYEFVSDRLKTLLDGRETLRFFVKEKAQDAQDEDSAWHKCPIHLKVSITEPRKRVAVDSVLEDYERPRKLTFDPIALGNYSDVHAGRMYLIEPTEQKSKFKSVPDRKRRAGVRMRWKARPDGIPADQWRLIGGFHLFDVSAEKPSSPISVSLIPQSAAGLEPSEMGDMSLIEAAYPSNETRRIWKKLGYTSWFSLAESAPLFPETTFRRSFMASVDEGLLASLFEKGIPDGLRLEYGDKPVTILGEDWISSSEATYDAASGWKATFKPGKMRRFFMDAVLLKALAHNTKIRITAYAQGKQLVQREYVFDGSPHMHPLMADTLDLLRYDHDEVSDQIYRRFEIVFDPIPGRTIDDLQGWIDNSPVKTDPYGWGVLRTLGLAAGFRVYDTGEGAFVFGKDLHGFVQNAFDKAVKRYPGVDIGIPFIDLFTAPLRNARVYSFDGGPDSIDPDRDVYDEQVALIQISLRPRILALTHPASEGVRYFVVQAKKTDNDSQWHFVLSADFTIDIFTLRTNVSTMGATLFENTAHPELSNLEAKFSLGSLTENDLIFAIRVVGHDVPDELDGILSVEVSAPPEVPAVKYPIKPVDLTQSPDGKTGVGEVLGLFPPLGNEAWAAQIFHTWADDLKQPAKPLYVQRFYDWTDRAGFTDSQPPKSEDRDVFAGRLVNWWKRFLDHGWGKSDNPGILESLGSIGKPGKWRIPEDDAGTVGVLMLEEFEYGTMKRYTVRPYGRYEAFVGAVDATPDAPPELSKDIPLVDIALPRTAPLIRPTILSSERIAVGPQDEALELVVARTPDENYLQRKPYHCDGIGFGRYQCRFLARVRSRHLGQENSGGTVQGQCRIGQMGKIVATRARPDSDFARRLSRCAEPGA